MRGCLCIVPGSLDTQAAYAVCLGVYVISLASKLFDYLDHFFECPRLLVWMA